MDDEQVEVVVLPNGDIRHIFPEPYSSFPRPVKATFDNVALPGWTRCSSMVCPNDARITNDLAHPPFCPNCTAKATAGRNR